MPGWKNSNSTRQRHRAYRQLTAAAEEVRNRGRAATAEPVGSGSFYVVPVEAPALARFDDGVASALQNHLDAHGLERLAATVPRLTRLSRRIRGRQRVDHSVSDVVYQMH